MEWVATMPARDAIRPLREALEDVARREVAFHSKDETVAEKAASRIVAKLLAGPMAALRRSLQRGEDLDAQAMMLLEMFAPPAGTPTGTPTGTPAGTPAGTPSGTTAGTSARSLRTTAERAVPTPTRPVARPADASGATAADRTAVPEVRSRSLAFTPEQVS